MQTRRHSLVSTTLGTSRELVSFHFGDAKRDGERGERDAERDGQALEQASAVAVQHRALVAGYLASASP